MQILYVAHFCRCLPGPSALLQYGGLYAYEVGTLQMHGVAMCIDGPVEVEGVASFVAVRGCVGITVSVVGVAISQSGRRDALKESVSPCSHAGQ